MGSPSSLETTRPVTLRLCAMTDRVQSVSPTIPKQIFLIVFSSLVCICLLRLFVLSLFVLTERKYTTIRYNY